VDRAAVVRGAEYCTLASEMLSSVDPLAAGLRTCLALLPQRPRLAGAACLLALPHS